MEQGVRLRAGVRSVAIRRCASAASPGSAATGTRRAGAPVNRSCRVQPRRLLLFRISDPPRKGTVSRHGWRIGIENQLFVMKT
jgi:hypothetical protein